MVKIGKLISRLIFLGLFGSWFTFTIWGIVTWNDVGFVTNKTTISLLYVPLFIGMFVIFIFLSIIGSISKGKKKKDEEKAKVIPKDIKDKIGKFFEKKTEATAEGEEVEELIPKDIMDKIGKYFEKKAEES